MLKAIETQYKGYRFRSRLEARWAVFFDSLGLKWEYEKEGFEFDGTRYLPDFWLPSLKLWVEIKGEVNWIKNDNGWTYSSELDKCEKFKDAQEWPVACVIGTPGEERIHFFAWDVTDSSGGSYQDDDSKWYITEDGIVTLDVNPHRDDRSFISNNLCGIPMPWFEKHKPAILGKYLLKNAYEYARSARFEHGETPHA